MQVEEEVSQCEEACARDFACACFDSNGRSCRKGAMAVQCGSTLCHQDTPTHCTGSPGSTSLDDWNAAAWTAFVRDKVEVPVEH